MFSEQNRIKLLINNQKNLENTRFLEWSSLISDSPLIKESKT